MRRIRAKDYVCPNCFQRPSKCKCDFIPWHLVMIDEKLQYAIQVLNRKHYLTEACCEGHFKKGQKVYMYISFAHGEAPGIPEGWKSSSRGNINYCLKADTKDDFEKQKNIGLEILNKWVDSLADKTRGA